MALTPQLQQLFNFVQSWHSGQKRKYTHEPYFYHLLNVTEIVRQYEESDHISAIALCHDLFEDTLCPITELSMHLIENGWIEPNVSKIIAGVTLLTDEFTSAKYPALNRSKRKTAEAARLGSQLSSSLQSVKYADLIDNTKSIVEHDHGFAKIYLKEKRQLLGYMRQGNIDLYIECCHQLRLAEEKINTTNTTTNGN